MKRIDSQAKIINRMGRPYSTVASGKTRVCSNFQAAKCNHANCRRYLLRLADQILDNAQQVFTSDRFFDHMIDAAAFQLIGRQLLIQTGVK